MICSICSKKIDNEPHFHNKFTGEYYHTCNEPPTCYERWLKLEHNEVRDNKQSFSLLDK